MTVARQAAVGNGSGDRAAGLAVVAAVAEPAQGDDFVDVRERLVEGVAVPQRQLAHAGRVEDEPALWQQVELTPRRGVAAATVVLADLADQGALLPREPVEEGRLADTG